MTYRIQKEFHFEAGHQLYGLQEGHQCMRPHGHSYRVIVILEADQLNEHGFVVDYGELYPLKNYIDDYLDHRNLNDVFDFQTTAENLAYHFFVFCQQFWANEIIEVRVSETQKTWASFSITK